ncbi:hypothetical protein MMC24_003714 [Lignoscripta atroalba]|nr:hypothetical protein [Lignoscripta atroalba]
MFTVAFIALALYIQNTRAVGPVVKLDYGIYEGGALDGVNQWLGIPYAAPPLLDLRFAAPQDPLKEKEPIRATKHRSACLSTTTKPDPMTSEDCLYLDVYAPSDATPEKPLPVLFFIQGGGFNGCLAHDNGTNLILASGNHMVMVSFTYRVGLYGFLASGEVQETASLNNGLKDQRKALEWVKKYINHFGGDPDHVVMAGASAGAASVTLQMSAYGGRDDNLFHATIAQSQSFGQILDVAESQYQYDSLVERTGCAHKVDDDNTANALECLRKLPIDELQKHNTVQPNPGRLQDPIFMYGPVIDDDLIQDYTVALFNKDKFVKVPTIFGDVSDEGTIFTPQTIKTPKEADDFLRDQYSKLNVSQINKLNNLYQITNPPTDQVYWHTPSQAYGELRYVCPGMHLSDIMAKSNEHPTYNYRYNVHDPNLDPNIGVPHGSEGGPIFDQSGPPDPLYTVNKDIIPVIQGYWTSFIRSFDPNKYRAPGTPTWEAWTGEDGMRRLLLEPKTTRMEDVSRGQKGRCGYCTSISVDVGQ